MPNKAHHEAPGLPQGTQGMKAAWQAHRAEQRELFSLEHGFSNSPVLVVEQSGGRSDVQAALGRDFQSVLTLLMLQS